MGHPDSYPRLVFADETGSIYDHPFLRLAGRSGRTVFPLSSQDLIPLPEGSELFVLPGRLPVGWDGKTDRPVILDKNPFQRRGKAQAVAAFVSPAHTQTALAAWERARDGLSPLPLFAYTAVGWWQGRFWAAAFRSDPDPRQDFRRFDLEEVRARTLKALRKGRGNRLIQHLGKCSLTYGCPAARNYFHGRFEAPLPTSPFCNARCLGCISLQGEGGPPAPQDRIGFVPTPEEIAGVAVPHLARVKQAIVSFGQGCEGEPLLQGETIGKAIRLIRAATNRGTINLNTNASLPRVAERLVEAGLESVRISMNSVREQYYTAYYRPKGYGYSDVLESWRIFKQAGLFVSLNLFVTPGFTDEEDELERLSECIESQGLDLIQLRNHTIDPDWYLEEIGHKSSGRTLGIRGMVARLKKRFPHLAFGYFNPPVKG
ncbi:MAG: radical SAM protein [Deltaproteobacteria bacterium]